mgnify:CR=1 FL=1
MTTVTIAGIPIGDDYPTRVCAEIGTNPGGNLDLAMALIRAAKEAGADMVKGQRRTPELAVPEAEWNEVRDTPWGKMPKLAYRHRAEFSDEQWAKLFDFAKSIGIALFTSVWDLPSLESMERLGSPCHKIPSARAHDSTLIIAAWQTGKPIILSTGMSDWEDVCAVTESLVFQELDRLRATLPERTVEGIFDAAWCREQGKLEKAIRVADAAIKRDFSVVGKAIDRWLEEHEVAWNVVSGRLVLLQCTSAYPPRADESNLRVIQTYKQSFGCPVGFSSHKIGIQTCLLAVAVGANVIERHITLSRDAKGSDHRMSSEPEDLARLVKEIRYAEACLGDGKKIVFPSEEAERKRLRGTPCTFL